MIYRNIKVSEWIKSNPGLRVIEGICNNCGTTNPTVLPFETSNTVGLESRPCNCGAGRFKVTTSIDKIGN